MKCAILFAVAAFAFLAQADAKNVMIEHSIDRGIIADALKAKLIAAKEKLDAMIDKAQDALLKKLTQVKEQAENLIADLKRKANKISDKIFNAAKEILDKVSDLEDKFVGQTKNIINKHDNIDAEYNNEII